MSPLGNYPSPSRNASDCSLPGSPTSTSTVNKPVSCHGSADVASVQPSNNTTVSCSTKSPSCHADGNCSNTNTDLSPYSSMQISTDGNHMGKSCKSEESLGKSELSRSSIKEQSSYHEADQASVSVPSTPNNNSIDNRNLTCNGNNSERNFSTHSIGISTLQHIFGKPNSATSISLKPRGQSSEVVDSMDDEKFSNKSPVKSSEDAVVVKAMSNINEMMNVQKNKSVDVASISPTKTFEQDKKDKELVMAKIVSSDSSSAAGDGSSHPSPTCHKVGRKAANKASSYVLKLSDKGHRSGKAYRMVQNVTEGSSTNSSFDEEQMMSHRKTGSSKRRDRSSGNMAEVSGVAVGNSPTHSSFEHRKNADRVVVDSFGDPDFGTPV